MKFCNPLKSVSFASTTRTTTMTTTTTTTTTTKTTMSITTTTTTTTTTQRCPFASSSQRDLWKTGLPAKKLFRVAFQTRSCRTHPLLPRLIRLFPVDNSGAETFNRSSLGLPWDRLIRRLFIKSLFGASLISSTQEPLGASLSTHLSLKTI